MLRVLNVTKDRKHCGHMGHVVSPFSQACELANKYGFDAVNIDLEDGASPAEIKELLEKNQLLPAACGSSLKLEEEHTENEFAASLTVFERQARQLHELACRVVLCYLPPFASRLNYYDYFLLMSRRLEQIKPILIEYGLRFGLEFIGPTETRQHTAHDFIHTLDGTRALIASAGLQGLAGFKLDVHHWQNSGAGLLDLHHLDVDEILYVELNDGLPGHSIFTMPEFTRELPLKTKVTSIIPFMQALKQKNYQGLICVEPWNAKIDELPLEEAIRLVKDSLELAIC